MRDNVITTANGLCLVMLKVTRLTDFEKCRRSHDRHDSACLSLYSVKSYGQQYTGGFSPIKTLNDGEVIEILAGARANDPSRYYRSYGDDYFDYEGRPYLVTSIRMGMYSHYPHNIRSIYPNGVQDIIEVEAREILSERADKPSFATMIDAKPKKKKPAKLYKEQGSWAIPL